MKRTLAILLLIAMLLSMLAIGTQAQTITTESSQNKLTDELKSYLETVDDDEYVPIYIWLNEQSEDMVYLVLSDNLGMSITKSSEESYITTRTTAKAELLSKGLENLAKMPEYSLQARATGKVDIANLTAETFKTQANIPEIMTNEEIKNCLESGMTSDEIINLSERTQFLSEYRTARKSLNNATNEQFYKLLDLDKCKNVYLDPLLAYVRMDCKKSYIDNLQQLLIVSEIGHHEILEFTNATVDGQSPTSTEHEYHMFPQNTVDGITYTGAGIKVGLLEYPDEKYNYGTYHDMSNPHLNTKNIITNSNINDGISFHITNVMAILAGDAVVCNDRTYQGIAPGASLCYTICRNNESFQTSMNWLIENDVSIINVSAMYPDQDSSGNYIHKYNIVSQVADAYITEYRVVLVAAASNMELNDNGVTGGVSNPALALNSIAVGNVMVSKKDDDDRYEMNPISSYDDETLFVDDTEVRGRNKPDIATFGSGVHIVTSANIISNIGDGTSLSAPMVSGTVALMMQATPNLIGKPDTIKAILMNSADEDAIYYNEMEGSLENMLVSTIPTVLNDSKISLNSTILRDRAGAGLLNIPAAIRLAKSGFYFDLMGGTFTSDTIYIYGNTTIEFGIVFEKYTNEIPNGAYSRQIDIQILDSTGAVIFESTDTVNNVKMFKCTILQSGDYRFRIITSEDSEGITASMNATMIVTCACKDKNITVQTPCMDGAHFVTCSCGFEIAEVHKFTDMVVMPLSNGATFVVEIAYLYERGNSTTGILECYDERYYFGPASGTNMTFQGVAQHENYSVVYTSTGKIVRYSYNVIIENNGQYSYVQTREVTVEYDYFAKTIEIS